MRWATLALLLLVACGAEPDVDEETSGESSSDDSSDGGQPTLDVPEECSRLSDCETGEACAVLDMTAHCIPADPSREPCSTDADCMGVGLWCGEEMETDDGRYTVCACNPNKDGACTNKEGECYDERILCESGCGADSGCYQDCIDAYAACLG